MVKEFKDWIDEFVEQGADPEKVTKWPEDFGGGSSGPVKLQEKTVSPERVSVEVTPDEGFDGLEKVTINAVNLQDKVVKPTTSSQEVVSDEGYVGLGKVTIDGVNLQEKTVSPTITTKEVTADSSFDGLSKVTVEAVALQDKVVKPTTSAQEIIPDDGYLGLGRVTVEASEAAATEYYQFIFNNHEDISSKRFSIDWSKLPDFFESTFGINPDLTFSEIATQAGTSDYAIRFPLAVGDTNANNKLYFNSEIYFILEINNNNVYLKRDGYLNGFLDFDISTQASKTLREAISLLPTTTTGTSSGVYALLILGVITLTEIN